MMERSMKIQEPAGLKRERKADMAYTYLSLGKENNIKNVSQAKDALVNAQPVPQIEPRSQSEPLLDRTGRVAAGAGARFLENLVGGTGSTIGTLARAAHAVPIAAANYLSGGAIPTVAEIEESLPAEAKPSYTPFPTVEQAQEVTQRLTGQKFEPKGALEETIQDIAADLGGALPAIFSGQLPFGRTVARLTGYAARSGLGNAAKQVTKAFGGNEIAQGLTKLAFMVAPSQGVTRRNLKQLEDESYTKAEEAIIGAKANATTLKKATDKIFDEVSKGDVPGKNFIKERIRALDDAIVGANRPMISVEDAWKLKKNLNAHMASKATPKEAIPYIKRLVGNLNEFLQDFGKKVPAFGENFNRAEDIHSGLKSLGTVSKFLKDRVGLKQVVKNPALKFVLFGAGNYYLGTPTLLKGTALGAAGLGTARGIQEIAMWNDLLRKSKTANKVAGSMVKNLFAQNANSFTRDVKKLDKIATKYEEESPMTGKKGKFTYVKI